MPPTIKRYITRLANVAIGPTTLRNQGAPGVAEAARKFLMRLDLNRFRCDSETDFNRELDRQTESLQKNYQKARKTGGLREKLLTFFWKKFTTIDSLGRNISLRR